MESKIRGYIGTYASPGSQGIYSFILDKTTGRLSTPELFFPAADSKYLSLHEGILASPIKREAGAGICLININAGNSGNLHRDGSEVITESVPSCHVFQDSNYVYTANYHEGTVLIYEKHEMPNGEIRLRPPAENGRIENGRGAGCHQVLLHEHYLLVPCLLQDQVRIFDRAQNLAPVGQLSFPEGTGPRHGIFDRKHKRLFLVSELSNQLFVYEIRRNGDFKLQNHYNILKEPHSGSSGQGGQKESSKQVASAAVRLSPDEQFLYVSTRFADLITVYKVCETTLTMVQQTGSGGEGPRDFTLTKDGCFLIAINRTSGGLVSFRLNKKDGTLEKLCGRALVSEGVSVVLDD